MKRKALFVGVNEYSDPVIQPHACRSNAFTGERGIGRPRDLAPMSALMGVPDAGMARRGGGHAIWRTCCSGQCAMELEQLEHGVFTLAINKVMSECRQLGRELTFDKPFMRLVVDKMQKFSNGDKQMPEDQYSGNWPGIVLVKGGGSSTYSQNVTKITSQPVVICPVCGRHNQIADTFRCRVCGKDYLCHRHYDEVENCCADCALKRKAEREETQRKRRAQNIEHHGRPQIGITEKVSETVYTITVSAVLLGGAYVLAKLLV